MQVPPIVQKLRPYLSVEITLDNLLAVEQLRLELAEARVEALSSLLEKRRQMLWPKDKEYTELDRKTRLEGDTVAYEANYRFLCQLEEIVKDRLELGRLIVRPEAD